MHEAMMGTLCMPGQLRLSAEDGVLTHAYDASGDAKGHAFGEAGKDLDLFASESLFISNFLQEGRVGPILFSSLDRASPPLVSESAPASVTSTGRGGFTSTATTLRHHGRSDCYQAKAERPSCFVYGFRRR
jgi:hypothetical protein